MYQYHLFSLVMLCSPLLFGAANNNPSSSEQIPLQDDELTQQAAPASSSQPTASATDQARKRMERAAAIEAFAKPAKRPRTRALTQAQSDYKQQFLDAISHKKVPELIEAYDQFTRSGGNPEELQHIPEFIAYINGPEMMSYLNQHVSQYLREPQEETVMPLKKLLLMTPEESSVHRDIKQFLSGRLTIKTKNDELVTLPIFLLIKYSHLLQDMYTYNLPVASAQATTRTLLEHPLPFGEPEILDLSDFSKSVVLTMHALMHYAYKRERNEPINFNMWRPRTIQALEQMYKLAEFLRVTKPIKDILAALALRMVYTEYDSNFDILDQLPPSAQQSIAAFSFLSSPLPILREFTWRVNKPFTTTITELIAWNRTPLPALGFLNLMLLHIADLTNLAGIRGIANVQVLDLTNNVLQTIKQGDFSNLPQILELNLANNQISRIAPHAFQGLNNLRVLALDHNLITSCPPGTFANLHHLITLSFTGNPISNDPVERARIEQEVATATNGQCTITW